MAIRARCKDFNVIPHDLLIPNLVTYLPLAAGADSGREELSPFVGSFLLGVLFAGFGALAYTGRWRRWARRRSHSVYKVFPLGIGWSGVGLMATGLGVFIPGEAAGIVVYPAMAFAALGMLGTVWLPRPFLPRWYKVEMGLEPRTPRKRAVASGSGVVRTPFGASFDEALESGAERDFGAASRLGRLVGGVSAEAHDGAAPSCGMADASDGPIQRADDC